MKINKLIFSLGLFFTVFYQTIVFAADNIAGTIQQTSTQYLTSTITQADYQKLTTDQQQAIAMMWNLSTTDYDHYLWLMNNTANGIYYQDKHLDPTTILGFNATTDAERQKYALIAIKNEQARVAKELAFQNIFYHLQRVLFPDQKPIADNKHPNNNNNPIALQAGDNLLYFVDITSANDDNALNHLISVIQKYPKIKLTIYVVGISTTDNAIRQWAAKKDIPPDLVKQNRISLNHDKGYLQKFTTNQPVLPLLLLLRDEHIQPFNLATM